MESFVLFFTVTLLENETQTFHEIIIPKVRLTRQKDPINKQHCQDPPTYIILTASNLTFTNRVKFERIVNVIY